MNRAEFAKLDRVEQRGWWFVATRANLIRAHRSAAASRSGDTPMLDAGCGTGALLARLAAEYPDHTVLGVDADPAACARAATKSRRPVCNASVNALPFADSAFAAIFSADVLCHRDVDEREAIAQFHRCLRAGGLLVLNLPSYQWMLSRHDVAVANIRRYTRRGIAALLRDAGFRLLFASYWNIFLFPIMVVTRKLLPYGAGAVSDVRLYPAPVEALARAVTGIERALLRCGVTFPCGGSLIAVAAKETINETGHA